jgi:hypothetical protein
MSLHGLIAVVIGLAALGCGGFVALLIITGSPRPERDVRRRRAF